MRGCWPSVPCSYPHSQPNPIRITSSRTWAKFPAGRAWGSSSGIGIDRDGKSVWVADRCGANSCAGKSDAPILKFDPSGILVKSFGEGMFVFPHGLFVDRGKGHQVFKFSPDGKILMALGQAGVAGDGPGTFNQPNAVVVAGNGDIFVSDGHSPAKGNARVMKFSKDGTFIKQWGGHGSAPGQFEMPHALAFDSKGRLFVADRGNNRIQIFDQDGKFLEEWKQFSRPSGIFIDKNDRIYVADSESTGKEGYRHNPGWKRGIRIGSAEDGTVTALIPDLSDGAAITSAAEGVAADVAGNVYGAEVGDKDVKKYVK